MHLTMIRNSAKAGLAHRVQFDFSYTYYNVESCRNAYHSEIDCFRMILSGKTTAPILIICPDTLKIEYACIKV